MSITALVSKSLESIRQDLFDFIGLKQDEYAASGWLPRLLNLNKGIVRGMIEIWAWGLWLLYQFLAVVLEQAFASTATGGWLDLHCLDVGVERKEAVKAQGTVYFVRTGSGGNVPIPAGRVVKTLPDGAGKIYRYITTAAVVLLDGETEVAVLVEAEDYGSAANATAGQISEIVTVIDGIDGVENRAGWLLVEGSDREADEPLRLRYYLAWKTGNGCTKYAYEGWALAVTGTESVRILDNHPRGQGTVDVVVKGTAGIPTAGLLALVDAAVQGNIPINDDALVKGPTPVNVAIAGNLELTSGNPDEILAVAENRLTALFASVATVSDVPQLLIGQDLPLELQTWAVMGIPGVKKPTWTNAATAVAEDELAVLLSVELTTSWASEE